MFYQQALKKLSLFKSLIGKPCPSYDSVIVNIIVSFTDVQLRKIHLENMMSGVPLPVIPSDGDGFGLFALLQNKKLINVKQIVLQDKVESLIEEAKLLPE